MCTCSILVTTTAKWKYLTVHNPHHFILYLSCQWLLASLPQWLLHWTDSLGRVGHVLLSLHRQSQSYSTVPSDQQIFFTFAKHLAVYTAISIWRTLTSAGHFTSFPGLLCSRILVYHACLLLDNMSTFHAQSCRGYWEKRWTDRRTHAHTQTDYNNSRCACAQPRVNEVEDLFRLCLKQTQTSTTWLG